MFFSDLPCAFGEVFRVLRSGGRFSVLAWGPMQQPYFEATIGTIIRTFPKLSDLAHDVPMFKFGESGRLITALHHVGFEDIRERLQSIPWNWPDTPEDLWEYFQEVTIPFKPLFQALTSAERDKANTEVMNELRKRYDGQQVRFDANMVLASATKP